MKAQVQALNVAEAGAALLQAVPCVDAVYWLESPATLYVVMREHGLIRARTLVRIEDVLTEIYAMKVRVIPWVHQGRGIEAVALGVEMYRKEEA